MWILESGLSPRLSGLPPILLFIITNSSSRQSLYKLNAFAASAVGQRVGEQVTFRDSFGRTWKSHHRKMLDSEVLMTAYSRQPTSATGCRFPFPPCEISVNGQLELSELFWTRFSSHFFARETEFQLFHDWDTIFIAAEAVPGDARYIYRLQVDLYNLHLVSYQRMPKAFTQN